MPLLMQATTCHSCCHGYARYATLVAVACIADKRSHKRSPSFGRRRNVPTAVMQHGYAVLAAVLAHLLPAAPPGDASYNKKLLSGNLLLLPASPPLGHCDAHRDLFKYNIYR